MSDLREAVAELLGIRPQPGDEWVIMCPSPDHNDARPSANIYVGEPMERLRGGKTVMRKPGTWFCFSCHRAGRITSEAIENYEPSYDRNVQVALENLEEQEVRVYPESWLGLYEVPGGIHPYWLGRFDEATCRRHRLGYDHEANAGTYPFRTPTGDVLGVVRRYLDPDARIKYRYPKGIDVHTGGFLYGYHDAVQRDLSSVILGEGALDAVACDEAVRGEMAAMAIYGSKISPAQVKMINRLYPKTIFLAFDNDQAGWDALELAWHQDWCTTDIRYVEWSAKDPGELSVSRRRDDIEGALTM